jgi:malonate-semialdehyde dehydrogenase (acetylating)/methylmalonate-semialdehyde dehydrogenase
LPDCDLELAADAAINAGFGSAGERCMAISAIVAVEPIGNALVARIKSRMAKIVTGDGTQGSDMGPLVTAVHRDKVASYIEAGAKEGATVVVDGRDLKVDGDGFFLGPTLLDNVTPKMSVYTDEIFGPVLSIIRVNTYDEALNLVNSHQYGNGTAIFTNDGGAARRFQNEVEVGMVGINVPIPVPLPYFSFTGSRYTVEHNRSAYCAALHCSVKCNTVQYTIVGYTAVPCSLTYFVLVVFINDD